jgi:hypothetical protein
MESQLTNWLQLVSDALSEGDEAKRSTLLMKVNYFLTQPDVPNPEHHCCPA